MGSTRRPDARIVRRIAEVDAAAWDRLAEDDVFARHGWLATLEETVAEATEPVYFLLEDGARLEGAAIGYRLTGAAHCSLDEMLLGRLARPLGRVGLSLRPALYCGPLIGQGRHLLWRRDHASAGRLIDCLLDAVCRHAAAERLNVAFAKLPVDERELLDAFAGRGFARTMNWPVSVLDLQWDSVDRWLASLGATASSKARREIAAPARNGVRIGAEHDFADSGDAIFALFEANQRAHSDEPLGIAPEFLRVLARRHADGSVMNVARADSGLAGAALLLTAGHAAGAPLIGMSGDPRNRKAFTYFNLAFYDPIRWCIEHGVRRLWLGAGAYVTKRRRGFHELGLALLIRHRSATGRALWRLLCALHGRWARAKLARDGVRLDPRGSAR
jgi:predicted N-acyltransferase